MPSPPITFTVEDLREPYRLERVLQQFLKQVVKLDGDQANMLSQLAASRTASRLGFNGGSAGSGGIPSSPPPGSSPSVALLSEDTHANRLANFTPPSTLGSQFYETDRTVLYTAITSGSTLVWEYTAGQMLAAAASRPSDLTTTDANFIFYATDTSAASIWTGAAWASLGGSATSSSPWPAFTAPVNGDFAWINQGGASVDATSLGIYLLAPAAAGDNIRIRKKTAPSTPYTITAAFFPVPMSTVNAVIGVGFRESGSGKLVHFGRLFGNELLQVIHYNSPTSFSATPFSDNYRVDYSLTYLRIQDDGTNRIYSVGVDGEHFFQWYSEARTTFLTADEILFAVNANSGTYQAAMKLLSWAQA